jgi:hypothetical protein
LKNSETRKQLTDYLTQYQQWFDAVLYRINACRGLILPNDSNLVIQKSPQKLNPCADYRSNINCLKTFHVRAIHKCENFLDDLRVGQVELEDSKRNLIKHGLTVRTVDEMEKNDIAFEYSEKSTKVKLLALSIDQESETRERTINRLERYDSPENVKFHLRRTDPSKAVIFEINTENNLLPIQDTVTPCYVVPNTSQEYSAYMPSPTTFFYIPQPQPVSRYSHEKFWPSCPQN